MEVVKKKMVSAYSNKKSQVTGKIITLVFILLAGMLGTIGLYEIGEDFIIDKVSNATQTAGNQSNISSFYINKMQDFETEYDTFNMPFDLIFAAILILGVVSILVGSTVSTPMSKSTFLFMITIGLFIFALVMYFVGQVVDWWLYDFFYTLFDGVKTDISIINWFFTYLEFNTMFIYVASLLLNQVEIDLSSLKGTGKREA